MRATTARSDKTLMVIEARKLVATIKISRRIALFLLDNDDDDDDIAGLPTICIIAMHITPVITNVTMFWTV